MSELDRPDPDALLSSIQRQESTRQRGRLKVFVGMCPGVGKTFAMLEAAHRELKSGRDVVIGYVETHNRKETDALAHGLPALPRRTLEYRGVAMSELDLDAILERRPQLAVVDELAHTNAPGARHPKRWQDIVDLLDAGIDVFSTLNVQHVESRAETVAQITGAEVRETVPDSVLDTAILELVDLPPTELLRRLHEGRVYLGDRAAAAARNFFRESNLTVLRELALRLVADHVGEDTRFFRRAQSKSQEAPWKTGHRLLVAVGPSPTSESLIRWTRRTADSLHGDWLAVHVEGPAPLGDNAESQLARNLDTARELGAEVISTSDSDLVQGILRVARDQNVTEIVVGKPADAGPLASWRAGSVMRRLIRESGNIDVHVVRAAPQRAKSPAAPERRLTPADGFRPYGVALAAVAGSALVNYGLDVLVGPRVPGLIFLLTVVLLALVVGRGPVLVAGAASALLWNFAFLEPRFTLAIERVEDALLFGTYFVVAVVLGQLVARIREQGDAERQREERATALYELTRDLSEATSRDQVVWQLTAQVNRVFNAPATVILPTGSQLTPHPDGSLVVAEKELAVADWAFRNRQAAGRFTHTLPAATAIHVPLLTERGAFGVLAVSPPGRTLSIGQRDLLDTYARQAALVLDRMELRAAAEKARLLAESERLGRTLLNSISHELRTPLAISTSAVSALRAARPDDPAGRDQLLAEITQANARLNRIVGNLLDVTRLESGQIRPRLDWHDARDLIQTTVREVRDALKEHPLTLHLPAEPLIAQFDFTLLQQALANLLLNAAFHTPAGTPVEVRGERTEDALTLTVADRGPGIPEALLPRLFQKFSRGAHAPAGGSGLGLAIVKGFVEAHGGTIAGINPPGGGARFTATLPQKNAPPPFHES